MNDRSQTQKEPTLIIPLIILDISFIQFKNRKNKSIMLAVKIVVTLERSSDQKVYVMGDILFFDLDVGYTGAITL